LKLPWKRSITHYRNCWRVGFVSHCAHCKYA